MNRKIISLITSVSLCAGAFVIPVSTVNAANDTLKGIIETAFSDGEAIDPQGINIHYNSTANRLEQNKMSVDTDMQVSTNTVWQEGYTSDEKDAGPIITNEASVDFNYQTVMYMKEVKDLYDKYIDTAELVIKARGGANEADLLSQLEATTVQGAFDITVIFDNDAMYNAVKTITAAEAQTMFSLNKDAAKESFDKLFQVTSVTPDDATKSIVIVATVDDNGTADGTKASKASLDAYLDHNIVLEKSALSALVPTEEGNSVTYTTRGTVTGNTSIYSGSDELAYIEYEAVQAEKTPDAIAPSDIAASVILTKPTAAPTTRPSGGGGGSISRPIVTPVPGTKPKPAGTPTPTLDPDVMVDTPDEFEADNHYEYIIGYPDDTVKPAGNISREEVATIFYRLLKADVRQEMFSQTNDFPDVEADRWSNNAISTLTNGGILNGYDDGTFKPAGKITRAEFIAIATRFYDEVIFHDTGFTDINGHWAEQNIETGVYYRLINGYEDSTFRPQNNITRAEAMTIINHILNRAVDKEGLLENVPQWPDNNEGDWYYYEVLEATRPHDYVRREENKAMENWTALREATDWEALEKTWTTGSEVQINVGEGQDEVLPGETTEETVSEETTNETTTEETVTE